MKTRQPYVGPRPFETDDGSLFFGRDREANDIVGLLIAHPLLVLFAQSGAGKSSLVNAKLIPMLEAERLEVLPPVRVGARISAEVDHVKSSNVFVSNALEKWRTPELRAPSLSDVTLTEFLKMKRRKLDAEGAPVLRVLIFDQLEEIFTSMPERWKDRQGFFEQVGKASQADPLLRILFVIREEYVPSLTPYKYTLPEQLAMTYRLEFLDPKNACRAIERPIEGTGRKYGEGVAQRLVKQLQLIKKREERGEQGDYNAEFVEPVQLQVVCKKLWDNLPGSVEEISDQHIQKFGDVNTALTDFYHEALQATKKKTGVGKYRMRRWFNDKLITPAKTRGTVFRGEKNTEGLPNKAVDELARQYIIRGDFRAGGLWYELTHDRLIEPIQRSNGPWLQRVRLYTRFLQVIDVLLLLALLGIYWLRTNYESRIYTLETQRVRDSINASHEISEAKLKLEAVLATAEEQKTAAELEQRDEQIRLQNYWLARGQINELRKSVSAGELNVDDNRKENAFRGVSSYLWTKYEHGDKYSLDTLMRILRDSKELIPSQFGIDKSSRLLIPPAVDNQTPWPLTLVYNPELHLDVGEIQYRWREMSTYMAAFNGIPVPMRLKIIPDEALTQGVFAVRLDTTWTDSSLMEEERTFVLTYKEKYVLIDEANFDTSLHAFFNSHKGEWILLPELKYSGPWWLVPAWTQPLWVVAGCPVYPFEEGVAVGLENYLYENPELVLNSTATKVIMEKVRENYPNTVEEALIQRGGLNGLSKDLVEILREEGSLSSLEFWLDALSQYRYVGPEAAVGAVTSHDIFHLGHQFALMGGERETDEILAYSEAPSTPYDEASVWLSVPQSRISVHLGRSLWNLAYDSAQTKIRPEILAPIDQSSKRIHQMFGVDAPVVLFGPADANSGNNGYRIEMLNYVEEAKGDDIENTDSRKVLGSLLERIRFLCLRGRAWWVTPEDIAKWIGQLPPNLMQWTQHQYSVTDLKLILRSVVEPTREEETASDTGLSTEAIYSLVPDERTLSQLPWLLKSLVFWSIAYNPLDCERIADCLVRTQSARLTPTENRTSGDDAWRLVASGIEDLNGDSIQLAVASFKGAISQNRQLAENAFLSQYPPQSSPESQVADFLSRCVWPQPGRISDSPAGPTRQNRYDAERLLDNYSTRISSGQSQKLRLYILWSYISEEQWPMASLVLDSLIAASEQTSWSASDAYLLAYWALDVHRWKMTLPPNLSSIKKLLTIAFHEMKSDEAEQAFRELQSKYNFDKAPGWFSSMLLGIADEFPESFWISFGLGVDLASKESGDAPAEGLKLLARAESNLYSVESNDQKRLRAWIDYYRATAFVKFAEYGNRDEQFANHDSAVAILNEVIPRVPPNSKRWPSIGALYSLLESAYSAVNEIDSAKLAVDRGLEVVPGNMSLLSSKFSLHLALLETDSALAVSDMMRKLATTADDSATALFTSAVAQIITNHPQAVQSGHLFLHKTKDDYRDYVRMLLYWILRWNGNGSAAQDYIDQRWKEIDPSTWGARMEQGDIKVWREMLIGHYKDDPRAQIFAYLKDKPTYEASPLRQLGTSYEGFCCEAYFYDALFQSVNGNPADRSSILVNGLKKVLATDYYIYYEYKMARYLKSKQDSFQ